MILVSFGDRCTNQPTKYYVFSLDFPKDRRNLDTVNSNKVRPTEISFKKEMPHLILCRLFQSFALLETPKSEGLAAPKRSFQLNF